MFYLYGIRQAVKKGKQVKTIKMKIFSKDFRTSNLLNRTVVYYTAQPH